MLAKSIRSRLAVPGQAILVPVLGILAGMLSVAIVRAASVYSQPIPALWIVGGGSILVVGLLSRVSPMYLIPLLMGVDYRVRVGAFSFSLAELSVAIVLFIGVVSGLRRQGSSSTRADVVLTCIVAAAALPSIVFATATQHALSVYRDFTAPLLYYACFSLIATTRKQAFTLVRLFVLVATANAVLGIVQFISGKYLIFELPEEAAWQVDKISYIATSRLGSLLHVRDALPVGLYSGTNNFAAYLVIPAVVALALAQSSSPRNWQKWLWRTCCVIMTCCLLLTFTRSSIFTLLVAFLFVFWFRRKRSVTIVGVIGSLLVGVTLIALVLRSGLVSWDNLGTLTGREYTIEGAGLLLRSHPIAIITGGFTEEFLANTYYSGGQDVHNVALYILIQFGAVTLICWFLLVILGLRRILQLIRVKDPELNQLGLALSAGLLVTVFLYAQTSPFADEVQILLWFFFWLGLGVSLRRSFRLESAKMLDAVDAPLPGYQRATSA